MKCWNTSTGAMRENSERFKDIRRIWVAIFLLMVASCSKVNKHAETVSKEVGELRFTVAYDPFANNQEGDGNEIEYFKIKLEQIDDLDIVQYLSETSGLTREEVLYYFSYRLQGDIFLEQGAQKEQSVLYHFERSFDLKSGRVFTMGFVPDGDKEAGVTLLIDSELLNTGPVRFKF